VLFEGLAIYMYIYISIHMCIYIHINQCSVRSSHWCSVCAQRKSQTALTNQLRLLHTCLQWAGAARPETSLSLLQEDTREVFRSGCSHANVALCLLRQSVLLPWQVSACHLFQLQPPPRQVTATLGFIPSAGGCPASSATSSRQNFSEEHRLVIRNSHRSYRRGQSNLYRRFFQQITHTVTGKTEARTTGTASINYSSKYET